MWTKTFHFHCNSRRVRIVKMTRGKFLHLLAILHSIPHIQSFRYSYQSSCDRNFVGWREADSGINDVMHDTCRHIYVLFHGFEQMFIADWMHRVADTNKIGCNIKVDWKDKQNFTNSWHVGSKLQHLRDSIASYFIKSPKFTVRGAARVSFFGFGVGAYVAAAVASHPQLLVTELHALDPPRVWGTSQTTCGDIVALYAMPEGFEPEEYFNNQTADEVIVYRTSFDEGKGVGLVEAINGTTDVKPIQRDMRNELFCPHINKPMYDSCDWWRCLHEQVYKEIETIFKEKNKDQTCAPNQCYGYYRNPLDARVAPKFYWNMKCSDYGWEELTNETIRFTCNEVKLVIDRADYIVENVGKPLWIEYIRRTHPTSCTIYVDWNPTKLQGLHLTYIIEKLPEIAEDIYQFLNIKPYYPTSRNNVEYFGYDVGAYIAAEVAKKVKDESRKIKTLYAIVPPTFGIVNNRQFYIDATFKRDDYLPKTRVLQAQIAREVVVYRTLLETLSDSFFVDPDDVLLLNKFQFDECTDCTNFFDKVRCFSESVRIEVARRYRENGSRCPLIQW